MKKLSAILMTLVMVFTVSCNNSGSEKEEEKDSKTTKVDLEALKNNPSDRQIINALDQFMKNVKSLAAKDDEKLFNETVDLFIALDDVKYKSDEVRDKKHSVKDHIRANEQLKAVERKIKDAAEAKTRGSSSAPQEVLMEQPVDEEVEYEEVLVETPMSAATIKEL